MKTQNTLIGRASGSVGALVMLTYRRKNIGRSKPLSVANPNTPAQSRQRFRYGRLRWIYLQNKEVIDLGFSLYSKKMYGLNAFLKMNINIYFTFIPPATTIGHPEKLRIGRGIIPAVQSFNFLAGVNTSLVVFFWSTASVFNSNKDDQINIVFYNGNKRHYKSFLKLSKREFGQITLDVGELSEVGNYLQGWCFFSSKDGRKISDTSFFTYQVT